MRGIQILCLFSFVCCSLKTAIAQYFLKNDKIIEAGIGLGIYDTKIYHKASNNQDNDKAAAWVYPVSLEYAITKRLGIGIGYKYSNFIIGNEDTINVNAQISGNDFILKPSLHLIRTKRIDLYVGALAGLAWFNYQINDVSDTYLKGNGSMLAFLLGTRLYFTKNIGMNVQYTYNNYNFVDLTIADNKGLNDILDLNLKRGNVSLGLVFKFN